MASAYDDELWSLVPVDAGPPAPVLVDFVRSLPRAERALDLGCGDGRLTAELGAETVVGADVSRVALDRARGRLAIELVELDPDRPLPLDDSSFDLVLCAETLEHVRDTQLLLSEARRVLRPGGGLAVTTPAVSRLSLFLRPPDPRSPHLRFFTRRSLHTLVYDMGFEVEALRRRGGTLLATAIR